MTYIAVTADEYETIVHMADTQKEMAEIIGVSIPTISKSLSHGYTVQGEYKVYKIEEDER